MDGDYGSETPAHIVNVYEHGRLVTRIRCESVEEAADVVVQWDEVRGVECVIEDLATRHGALDVLASEPEDLIVEDEYRV